MTFKFLFFGAVRTHPYHIIEIRPEDSLSPFSYLRRQAPFNSPAAMPWFNLVAIPQWYMEGLKHYGHQGYANARETWADPDMDKQKDLSGKHYIVTGSNSGIGFATAEALAKRKAIVHMVCRNEERANEARDKIVQAAKEAGVDAPNVQVHLADFGSMESVRAFGEKFARENDVLHALINNAGALFKEETRTALGVELSMAVSMSGSFLLTGLLLPLLKKAPKGRVVNVSSGGQYLVGLDAHDLAGKARTGAVYNGAAAYAYAKRAQVELTSHWARHPAGKGVIFHSMHPGWAKTPGVATSLDDFSVKHADMMRDQDQGADTAVWLAIADEPAEKNGLFWLDRSEVRTDMRLAFTKASDSDRETLWKECEKLCGWSPSNV
jgi:dehydrogenase/reductase SDR family member 12